ncbi:MAG TPA: hypothetical protein VGM12_28865 [Trebonia sp.]|jgi:hypothetical protein
MTTTVPLSPEPPSTGSQEKTVAADGDDEELSWLLAAALIETRRQGDDRPQDMVMALLAEMTVERGAGTVTLAALGLADVAAKLLEAYAGSLGEAPHAVLRDALTTLRGTG